MNRLKIIYHKVLRVLKLAGRKKYILLTYKKNPKAVSVEMGALENDEALWMLAVAILAADVADTMDNNVKEVLNIINTNQKTDNNE